MLTAIIILTLLSFKDELIGFIDLYSTLQGNKMVYAINAFVAGTLGSIEFYWDFWLMEKIESQFGTYMCLMLIVNILGTAFGVIVLHNKQKLKHWIKRKRISKSMKKKWQLRKETIDGTPIKATKKTDAGKEIPGTGNDKNPL